MRHLLADDMLMTWEQGQDQHPADRALTLLSPACPEYRRADLLDLSIGQRDALLLEVRERTFGESMEVLVDCPRCAASLEFGLSTAQLRTPAPPVREEVFSLVIDDVSLRYRLPTSADQAAVAGCRDAEEALGLLLDRCVLAAGRDGAPLSSQELTAPVIGQLAARMVEQDPQAELLLSLQCPSCGHAFEALLDIAASLWTELSVHVRRLLSDVHTLARTYGWREADILSMSARRRQLYLEMVES